MFKRCLLFAFAAALALPLFGCGGQSEAALPQLVIGCGDCEPYHYINADGESAGIDVELAREACARMGYEPVFYRLDWNDRDAYLESGEIDCLWSCLSMDSDGGDYAWVGPYMRSRQVVAVLKDSPVQTLGDLENKTIAVRMGGKAEKIFLGRTLSAVPAVRTVYSQTNMDEVVTALRSHYVDAVAGYAATIQETLQSYDVDFRFLEQDLSQAALGIAFPKDSDPALRSALSQTLSEMRWDGTTQRILEAYGVDTAKALRSLDRRHSIYGGQGHA